LHGSNGIIGPIVLPIHEPLETAELLAFTRAVEAKSLSRAAAELRVPRATVGRRLARLEQRLGVRLLRRSTRSLALTQAGEVFYRHALSVLESITKAEQSVHHHEEVVRGEVRVSMPPITAASFSELVVDFALKYPDVRIHVDFSTRLVDLQREGYDVALRATPQLGAGLIARNVSRHTVMAVASPEYLAKAGVPKTLKDLRSHRCLSGFLRGEIAESTWKGKRGAVNLEPVMSSNHLALIRDAVLAGVGIALLPEPLVAKALRQGELKRVLPHLLDSENKMAVVYVERELLPVAVRAFVEALVAWAPDALANAPDLVPPPPSRRKRGSH
jgi:DNA-binding transcriptional LysR family regulator